ncbi:MAG TPA: anhydro-N-acetylmuramic acid kinase [Spongiibacteraceae bacterium]|jgi:anhydro-N-acetylmuramic acid kinase
MASNTSELYVGLMSGTSLDGIDALLLDLSFQPKVICAQTYALPDQLRADLLALCQSGNDEIERMGAIDRRLGLELGFAVTKLLRTAEIPADAVRAIGSHGQTIRHRPPLAINPGSYPFTLQIGDPNSIAEVTGITTVADFRRRDIAAGGQGAPLVPAFHRALFGGGTQARAIVNIGGIANITGLGPTGQIIGFDTGPGNTLLDSWIHHCSGARYDRDGAWGANGTVIKPLLDELLRDPYFALPAPKSTGREYFHTDWLDRHLADSAFEPIDVQATLVELTARSIAAGIANLPFAINSVFVCGGGAYNRHLMLRLEALLHPRLLGSTTQLGIAPEWVEAAAFAWLGQQTLRGKPGNEPAVTGASHYRILGAIYPA